MRINWEAKIALALIEEGAMDGTALSAALLRRDGLRLEHWTLQRMLAGGDLVTRPDGTLYPTRRGALLAAGVTPAAPHALMERWRAGL